MYHLNRMMSVVKQVRSSFAVMSALFITVITSKVRAAESCGLEELMQCAKPLSVLTDSGLTSVSSKADLDKICPDLKEAIKCIHSYTRYCMNHNHRRHFKKLFHGTSATVIDLCQNGTYQDEYLRHAPCMKKVEPQNEICFKRYTRAMNEITAKAPEQQPEQTVSDEEDLVSYQKKKREAADEGIKNVCCSFQEYVECSTQKMRLQCGEDTAEFSRKFLDKMSLSMITLHCSEYGRRECGLMSSSSPLQHSTVAILLLATLAYLLR